MFSALKRNRDESNGERDQNVRLVRALLDQVEASVVKGPVWDLEWLHLRYTELRVKLEKASTAVEVSAVSQNAVEVLREYNEAVSRHFVRQAVACEASKRLLTRALAWAKTENDSDAVRAQALLELLDRNKGGSDPASLTMRFSKAANYVRDEWSSRRRQNTQTLAQFQEEVAQAYAEPQSEVEKRAEAEKRADVEKRAEAEKQAGAERRAEAALAAAPAASAEPTLPTAPLPVDEQTPPELEEDPVTGLPGRATAEHALGRALAAKRSTFVAMISIDQLGMISDRYGDKMAGEVLFFFGQQYAQVLDVNDTLYRWGKCTFVVLLDRDGSKEWIRGQVDRLFNVRFRKNASVNERTVMLNVGVSWKLWAPAEMPSLEAITKQLGDFEKDHTREK